MYFQHAAALWRDFPALVPGVLYAEAITADAAPGTEPYTAAARARLAPSRRTLEYHSTKAAAVTATAR